MTNYGPILGSAQSSGAKCPNRCSIL
jgi:hypothetical protein